MNDLDVLASVDAAQASSQIEPRTARPAREPARQRKHPREQDLGRRRLAHKRRKKGKGGQGKRTRQQLQKDVERRAATLPQDIIRVIPWKQWLVLRDLSEATGRRLAKAGRIKVTSLSARRIGVRTDHDREYLDSCLREVTS
jgi:hypothetical protein